MFRKSNGWKWYFIKFKAKGGQSKILQSQMVVTVEKSDYIYYGINKWKFRK